MASPILQKVETAVAQVVAKPLPEVISQLQDIAQSEPVNPIPHLVMAGVSGFAHRNLADSKAHLENAKRLLEQGRNQPHDIEWEFAQSLCDWASSEMLLAETKQTRLSGTRLDNANQEQILQAAGGSRKALNRLGALAPKLRDSSLVRTLYAALLAHAQSLGLETAEYRRGMKSLQSLAQGQGGVADLAGFFLMYGYRRSRNYKRAAQVGQELARRNPKSVLPKIMLGSVYYFMGNMPEAAEQLKRALALAPQDPHPYLAYAHILEKTGQLDDAKEMLQKARQLDRQGVLSSFIESKGGLIQVKERIRPR